MIISGQFIRAQMGWAQVLQARAQFEQGGGGRVTEQEAVRRMMEQGGARSPRPRNTCCSRSSSSFRAAERGSRLAQRRREARTAAGALPGMPTRPARIARGLVDVPRVRDLGRVLQPQLPPDWKDQVSAIRSGQATAVARYRAWRRIHRGLQCPRGLR